MNGTMIAEGIKILLIMDNCPVHPYVERLALHKNEVFH